MQLKPKSIPTTKCTMYLFKYGSNKHSSNHSAYEASQVLLLFLYETRNTADDVCWVWTAMALVYKNIQVGAITIDCIRLWQGI